MIDLKLIDQPIRAPVVVCWKFDTLNIVTDFFEWALGALRAPKRFSYTATLRWKIPLLRTKEKKHFCASPPLATKTKNSFRNQTLNDNRSFN